MFVKEEVPLNIGSWAVIDEPYSNPPWEKIIFDPTKKPFEQPLPKVLTISGLQTQDDGLGNLKAINTLNGIIEIGSGQNNGLSELLEFFFSKKGVLYVVYYPYELDIIIKTFGFKVCKNVLLNGTADYSEYELWFTPNRNITIKYRGQIIRIQSLYEWFKGTTFTEALKFAGITETGSLGLTLLALKLNRACVPLWGHANGNLSSPSIITGLILNNTYKSISTQDVPEEVYRLAYTSFHAPWIELFQMGRFREIHDYDLNSAYPVEVKNLIKIDRSSGKWIFTEGEYVDSAEYGFCHAIISIDNIKISPILLRKGGGLFSPRGTWIGTITKDEIDFIYKYKIGKVQILSGWWFVPTVIVKPFLRPINKFLQIREQARKEGNNLLDLAIKLSSARLVGKFLQKHQDPLGSNDPIASATFNPVYAAVVMTRVKLRVAELVMLDPDAVLSVVVDGLATSRPLDLSATEYAKTSTDIGGVKLKAVGDGIVVSPFVTYFTKNKKPFILPEFIARDPWKRTYTIPNQKRIRICQSILMDLLDGPVRPDNTSGHDNFNYVGQELDSEIIMEVGKDTKRSWDILPEVGAQLLSNNYVSDPMLVDMIEVKFPTFKDDLWETIRNREKVEGLAIEV